jgi:hypothetical protein
LFVSCLAKTFDPAEHFETPKELLSRRFNRPRASTVEEAEEKILSGKLAEVRNTVVV